MGKCQGFFLDDFYFVLLVLIGCLDEMLVGALNCPQVFISGSCITTYNTPEVNFVLGKDKKELVPRNIKRLIFYGSFSPISEL